MDKLILTDTGGFPLKLDDILWQVGDLDSVNWGIYDAIQAHLLAYGTDYIVEGCTYGAPNVAAGWIMLAGELMRVDAHAGTDNYFVRTQTFDARGSKIFKDTTVNNTYEKIRGVLSGASGTLNITTALRLEDKIVQLIATSAQQFAVANIPDLPTSIITSGVFIEARLPLSTTTLKGIVIKSSLANAQAGLADAYVDAATLQSLIPSTSYRGLVELATQTEVNTGADTVRGLTPATLRGTVFTAAQIPAATITAIGGVEKATAAETLAGTTGKFIDAELLQGHGAWQTPSYVDNHSDYTTGDFSGLRYRKLTNGMLQLAGSVQRSVVSAGIIFTLSAGYRPAQTLPIFGRREDDALIGGTISSAGVVTCFLGSAVADDHLDFNVIVPMDLTV